VETHFNSHCSTDPVICDIEASLHERDEIDAAMLVLTLELANFLFPMLIQAARNGRKNARGVIRAVNLAIQLRNIPLNQKEQEWPKFLFNLNSLDQSFPSLPSEECLFHYTRPKPASE
jgi:hypothetical protein